MSRVTALVSPRHAGKAVAIALSVAALGLGGCSNMTQSEQRILSGAAIGTVGGALVGAATGGSTVWGGVIGAAAGATGGYVYDQVKR